MRRPGTLHGVRAVLSTVLLSSCGSTEVLEASAQGAKGCPPGSVLPPDPERAECVQGCYVDSDCPGWPPETGRIWCNLNTCVPGYSPCIGACWFLTGEDLAGSFYSAGRARQVESGVGR
jgi:hypothetical protein